MTDSVNYRLTAVHRFQTGIQSAITERTDLRLNVRYAMSSRANWSATFLYSISDRAGTRLIEHYTLIGPDLTFNYRINQRLQASLGYRYRNRDSDLPGRNYDVNLVTLNVRYRL